MKANKSIKVIDHKSKKVSANVKNLLPNRIVETYPDFVTFLEYYYKWMESEDAPLYDSNLLLDYFFIDSTKDKFLPYFIDEYMVNFPNAINENTNIRLLLKNISDFYSSKGTEDSIKFLFKILFNEDNVIIFYPSDYILRASDGRWQSYAKIKVQYPSNPSDLVRRKVYGKLSGASGVVSDYYKENDDLVIILVSVNGIFISDEIVETRDSLIKISTITLPIVYKVEIINAGNGYLPNEYIYLSYGITLVVKEVDNNGSILKVELTTLGNQVYSDFIYLNANNKNSDLKIRVGGMFSYGNYNGHYGKLSDECVLQNGLEYQEFSYTIKSETVFQEYYDYLIQTVHPTGIRVNSIIELTEDIKNITIDSDLFYDIYLEDKYVTLNDLEIRYPNETLEFYYDQLLNNYMYTVETVIMENEIDGSSEIIIQDPPIVINYPLLVDEFNNEFFLVTEDGNNIIY